MDNPIIFAEDLPDSTIHDRVSRNQLARLARGIYATETDADPSDVVRRSWRVIRAGPASGGSDGRFESPRVRAPARCDHLGCRQE